MTDAPYQGVPAASSKHDTDWLVVQRASLATTAHNRGSPPESVISKVRNTDYNSKTKVPEPVVRHSVQSGGLYTAGASDVGLGAAGAFSTVAERVKELPTHLQHIAISVITDPYVSEFTDHQLFQCVMAITSIPSFLVTTLIEYFNSLD